jgi:hypothetical protein
MPDLFPITKSDKLACIEREIKMRETVYPRWVTESRMSQTKADRELEVMRAIAEDYRG